jgi:hypothetical protein
MCCIYGNTSALIRHLAASDPFVIAGAGLAYFRLADLIRLAEQIRELLA